MPFHPNSDDRSLEDRSGERFTLGLQGSVDCVIVYFRILGWSVLAFGLVAFRYYASAYFNPTAQIIVDNSATADAKIKLAALLASALFLVSGAILGFLPPRIMRRVLRFAFGLALKFLGQEKGSEPSIDTTRHKDRSK